MKPDPRQLDLLGAVEAEAVAAGKRRRLARETAHLPDSFAEAVAWLQNAYHQLDTAIRCTEPARADAIIADAWKLALKLNGGSFGVLAPAGAGEKLMRATAAPRPGTALLWGQPGEELVTLADGTPVRVRRRGIWEFNRAIAAFACHVVDRARPFPSETGYRSALSGNTLSPLGLGPAEHARDFIQTQLDAKRWKMHTVRNPIEEKQADAT